LAACAAQAVECIRNDGVGKSKQTSLFLDPCVCNHMSVINLEVALNSSCSSQLPAITLRNKTSIMLLQHFVFEFG